jgi:hypothetical protein
MGVIFASPDPPHHANGFIAEVSMRRRLSVLLLGALTATLAAVGCGGNPSSPSGSVVVQGTVLGGTAGNVSAQSAGAIASAGTGRITVTVAEDPTITVTVSGNGTFHLEGLPLGTFTLIFQRDGVTLGTVIVTGVREGSEVKIVVQIDGSTVVVIELKVDEDETDTPTANCIINGGRMGDHIELEGNVASGTVSSFKLDVNGNRARQLVDVATSGPSTYTCVGQAGKGDCPPVPLAGAKVHVSGTLTSCSTSAALVTASEVKVQKP